MEPVLQLDCRTPASALKKAIPSNREEYLGWVAEWRGVINALSDTIRQTRRLMQMHGHLYQSLAQSMRNLYRQQANELYKLRGERQMLAMRQREGLRHAA